tara:strand:- start:765 stop:1346 length:582 start_codon:yes stop_codon:yes gene_type:complete
MKYVKKLKLVLEKRIKRYHEDYTNALIAEMYEEVLHRSLLDIGLNSKWENNRSHKIGEDIFEESIGRISCKSGALSKDSVEWNGSRTGKYETLAEKLEFLSSDHDDYYFMLAKDKKNIIDKNFKYKVLIFPSSLCKVNELNWEEKFSRDGKLSGWKGTGNFNAKIVLSMSGQLWTTLPLDMVEHIIEIDGNPV